MPTLEEMVNGVGTIPFRGLVYRHIAPHRGCTSGEGARQAGGRWNPPDSFPVMYTALDETTVLQEFYRLAERSGLAVENFLPRTLCVIEVDVAAVLDLRNPQNLTSVGLTPEQLRSFSMRECQAVGDAAHRLDLEGVLAPSATGAGNVLAVFELKLRNTSRVIEVQRRPLSVP